MSYLYETHLHTSQSSACAWSPGRDYISVYRDLGYTGIIVTDHFIGGNSALNRHQPWRDWVSEFCRGYEDARNEGEKQGLDVFFGWEETFDGDDYLVYGLDKAWLLEHPEAKNWTRKRQYETVRQYGGCVVHAHPFRQALYIPRITLCPAFVDAVEVANAGNLPSWNVPALRYAQKIGLPVTAGSDIHDADTALNTAFGVYLDKKLTSIADYVAAIRDNTIAGLRADDSDGFQGDEPMRLRITLLDAQEDGHPVKTLTELWDMLPLKSID